MTSHALSPASAPAPAAAPAPAPAPGPVTPDHIQGVLEDTIIAFSIDNGGVPYAGAFNYPLRGAKVESGGSKDGWCSRRCSPVVTIACCADSNH